MTTERAREQEAEKREPLDEAAMRDEAVRLGWAKPAHYRRRDDVPTCRI